jgi:membrane associated rhomboid family serine protease
VIPIHDSAPRLRPPLVVPLLILVNVAVFVWQWQLPEPSVQRLFARFGVNAVDFLDKWQAVSADPGLLQGRGAVDWFLVAVLPVLTCMFLHAGPMHLLGNMLFLWVYGDNVEGRFGRWRFLAFYLLSGTAAVVLHCQLEPLETKPIVGASGAIAGVLGAYLLLFPRARIHMLVPIFVVWLVVDLPAFVVLLAWFALQIPHVQGVLGWLSVQGVAWWAHVGGFLAGMALVPLFLLGNPPPPRRRARAEA